MTQKVKWIMWGMVIGFGLANLELAWVLCALMAAMK